MVVFGSYDVVGQFVVEGATATSFGAQPSPTTYRWIGAVQNLEPTLSRNALAIYSFDARRDVRFYPYMHRAFDYRVVFYPQNLDLFTAGITSVNNTYYFEEIWTPQAGVAADNRRYRFLGNRAARERISWRIGQPIQVEIDFMFRNVPTTPNRFPDTVGLSGFTDATEITTDPFLFSDAFVALDPLTSVGQTSNFTTTGVSGTLNVLEAELTVNNRLDREAGYTIGDTQLANLPVGRREIDFAITRLFEDQNQVDQFNSGITQAQGTNFRIRFPIGTTNTITLNNAKWNPLSIPKDVRRDVLIFRYTGKAYQPVAGGSAITLA